MRKSNEFLGLDGFIWWTGVVEDRNDPLQLGRCRVRCMGWHDENQDKLPTGDLPWAQPLQPITSAALSGIGTSPTGLVEGSWVVGFFMDGKKAQFPIIMGSISGISGEGEVLGTGFRDPYERYPLEEFKGKPDTPTLARGEEVSNEESPAYRAKVSGRTKDVPIAKYAKVGMIDKEGPGRDTWNEPFPRYGTADASAASTYPYNHVTKTEGGHIFEIDNTPEAERIHTQHGSGTFEEIQPDGTKITKIVGKNYEIVLDDENVFIKGGQNITVTGDARIMTQGSFTHEVEGDYFLNVKGDYVSKIGGSRAEEVTTDLGVQIGGTYTFSTGDDSTISFGSDVTQQIVGDYDVSTVGDFAVSALGTGDIILDSAKDFGVISKAVSIAGTEMSLNSDGKLTIKSSDTVRIESAAEENTIKMVRSPALPGGDDRDAKVEIKGTANASVNVLAGDDGIDLDGHVHGGVTSGSSDTGASKT